MEDFKNNERRSYYWNWSLSKELIGYILNDNMHNLLGCWGDKDFNNPDLSKFL